MLNKRFLNLLKHSGFLFNKRFFNLLKHSSFLFNERFLYLLKRSGFLFGGFLITGFFLVFFCYIAQTTSHKGLKEEAARVLAEKYSGVFTIGESVPFNTAFALNGAAFTLYAFDGQIIKDKYAVIMRVITMYGPVMCVFISNVNESTAFEGFVSMPENVQSRLNSPVLLSQISFWGGKIPQMLKTFASGEKQ